MAILGFQCVSNVTVTHGDVWISSPEVSHVNVKDGALWLDMSAPGVHYKMSHNGCEEGLVKVHSHGQIDVHIGSLNAGDHRVILTDAVMTEFEDCKVSAASIQVASGAGFRVDDKSTLNGRLLRDLAQEFVQDKMMFVTDSGWFVATTPCRIVWQPKTDDPIVAPPTLPDSRLAPVS